jgi:hypothetical protein
LKIAGDLRLRSDASSAVLERTEPAWFAEERAQAQSEPAHVPEMEVIELQSPDSDIGIATVPGNSAMEARNAAQSSAQSDNPDDLFARMEDLLGDKRGNSSKNT